MGKRKEFTGIVIKDAMQKTRIVRIMQMSKHPKYGRIMKSYNKFKVHDEENTSHTGDTVRIQETRPISKEKHFRLLEVVKKAIAPHVQLKEENQ